MDRGRQVAPECWPCPPVKVAVLRYASRPVGGDDHERGKDGYQSESPADQTTHPRATHPESRSTS